MARVLLCDIFHRYPVAGLGGTIPTDPRTRPDSHAFARSSDPFGPSHGLAPERLPFRPAMNPSSAAASNKACISSSISFCMLAPFGPLFEVVMYTENAEEVRATLADSFVNVPTFGQPLSDTVVHTVVFLRVPSFLFHGSGHVDVKQGSKLVMIPAVDRPPSMPVRIVKRNEPATTCEVTFRCSRKRILVHLIEQPLRFVFRDGDEDSISAEIDFP